MPTIQPPTIKIHKYALTATDENGDTEEHPELNLQQVIKLYSGRRVLITLERWVKRFGAWHYDDWQDIGYANEQLTQTDYDTAYNKLLNR